MTVWVMATLSMCCTYPLKIHWSRDADSKQMLRQKRQTLIPERFLTLDFTKMIKKKKVLERQIPSYTGPLKNLHIHTEPFSEPHSVKTILWHTVRAQSVTFGFNKT